MTYSTLTKFFAASSLALAVTGCASVPGTAATGCMDETKSSLLFLFQYSKREFNKGCALKDLADQYAQSPDDGEKVLGQHLREEFDPVIKAKAQQTRDEAVEKTTPYQVKDVEVKDGVKTLILTPVKKVPAAAP